MFIFTFYSCTSNYNIYIEISCENGKEWGKQDKRETMAVENLQRTEA